MEERLQVGGFRTTGAGGTHVELDIAGADASIAVTARWMGQEPLAVVLRCTHHATGSCSGVLELTNADGHALPPAPEPIVIEYVRVPEQPCASGQPEIATNDAFTHVVWLHPDSMFDDGSDLPAGDYDPPIAAFAQVARALAILAQPWKLV